MIRSPETTSSAEAQPDDGWRWWGGISEEWCTIGPHLTRDAVIAEAIENEINAAQGADGRWTVSVFVCEARQDPLRLADWIDAERLIERAEESLYDSDRVSGEYDEGPFFRATPEQEKDLITRIKAACDQWQAEHGLKFACSTFSDCRNSEMVCVPVPEREVQA